MISCILHRFKRLLVFHALGQNSLAFQNHETVEHRDILQRKFD